MLLMEKISIYLTLKDEFQRKIMRFRKEKVSRVNTKKCSPSVTQVLTYILKPIDIYYMYIHIGFERTK